MNGPYPRTLAYIAQLPRGLESFPECEGKASVYRKVFEFADMPLQGLPPELQHLLDAPLPASTRVAQCQILALVVAMVEARRLDPRAEGAWIRQAATHLFSSQMYRLLMWAATPGIVFRTANLRWSAFFSGTSLSPEVSGRAAVLHLHAPPRLFNDDLSRIFVDVIWAAVNYTRKESGAASVTLGRHDAQGTHFDGAW